MNRKVLSNMLPYLPKCSVIPQKILNLSKKRECLYINRLRFKQHEIFNLR